LFGDKKGGGTAASLLFTLIIYFIQLNVLELSILFIVLVLIYILTVDDQDADDDPSWITLDEIVGMSLVSVASPSRLLPLIAGFIVFRLSDIMKQPRFVKDLENYPGKLGVLYDDLGAGLMGLLSGTIVNQIITLTL
jgi:phosphatidylglycerophosphatase A